MWICTIETIHPTPLCPLKQADLPAQVEQLYFLGQASF